MRTLALVLALLVVAPGCGPEANGGADGEAVAEAAQALSAYCTASVQGIGDVDVETDYLPHVVQCENGGADIHALRAQAISARSYLYYKLETSGSVKDGTGDQVYSCGAQPTELQHQAVKDTSGLVLRYAGVTVCAFYVAGAYQDPPSCMGGGDDPTGTEHFVTYNEGLSGDGIEQTTLGWVNPGNYRNRGCMSQWGARCLEETGRPWQDILHFYYGADIGIEQAAGPCVEPLPPEGGGGAGQGGDGAGAPGGGGPGEGGSGGGVDPWTDGLADGDGGGEEGVQGEAGGAPGLVVNDEGRVGVSESAVQDGCACRGRIGDAQASRRGSFGALALAPLAAAFARRRRRA